MAVLLAVLVALISLIITPGYHFSFDITPKVVVLLAGGGLLLAWAARSASWPDGTSRVYRWFSLLLVLNVLSLIVSTLFSSRPDLSVFGTNWRRFGSVIDATICLLAWLTVVACAGRPDRVRFVLRGVAIAGAIAAGYGIAQYAGWDPLLARSMYQVGEGSAAFVRPPGTFGYASYFATWLLLAAFLSAAMAAMEKTPGWRRFARAVSVFAIFAMCLTGTRAAILGLLAGAAVWFAIRKFGMSRRYVSYFALALIAAAAFYASPLGQSMRNRARWTAGDPWGGARIALWRDSLHMSTHRLLTGYGPETFTGEFPRYESAALVRAYPDFSHESPHNIFLDALVAQGLPGVVLLFGLCGIAFTTRRQPEITAGLAAAIVSQQFTSFTAPTAMMFFVAIALLVALETPPAEKPLRKAAVFAAAVPVGLALAYLAFRLSAADHALQLAKMAIERGDSNSAASIYQHYDQLRLPGGTGDLWYSRALLELASKTPSTQQRQAAIRASGAAAQRAIRTAEDPFNAWYNLATFYGALDDAAGSERSVRAAIAARPNWYKPHWILAQLLELRGEWEEAKREANRAAYLNDRKDPEVVRTSDAIADRLPGVSAAPDFRDGAQQNPQIQPERTSAHQ
jgi:tetratricopeptide (TPR) repeat protein